MTKYFFGEREFVVFPHCDFINIKIEIWFEFFRENNLEAHRMQLLLLTFFVFTNFFCQEIVILFRFMYYIWCVDSTFCIVFTNFLFLYQRDCKAFMLTQSKTWVLTIIPRSRTNNKRSGFRHLRPSSSRVSYFERILSGFWHASTAIFNLALPRILIFHFICSVM